MKTYRYDSIAAYQAAGEDMSQAHGFNQQFREFYSAKLARGTYAPVRDWFGPFRQDERAAANALKFGWKEGTDQVLAIVEKFRDELPPPRSVRRRIRRADQGDSLEVQDVYCGRLDTAWRVPRREAGHAPEEIWLANYMGLSFNQEGSKLFWRGVAIAVVTDLLSAAGYYVGIMAYTRQRGAFEADDDIAIEVTIKDPKSPLDVDALTSCTANPAFYRLLYWNWCSSRPIRLNTGLGGPSSYDLPSNFIKNDGVHDETTAMQFIDRVLADLSQREAA